VPKHISEFLSNVVLKQENWKIKLLQNWSDVIGGLKDRVIIEKVDKNLLVLRVCHPAFAQELFLISDLLKQRVNSVLGKDQIKEIRFITATIKKSNIKKQNIKDFENNDNNGLDNVFLTPSEKKSLSKITDNELREYLEKFYLCCKKGRKRDGKVHKGVK
jgi:hypothetical protein